MGGREAVKAIREWVEVNDEDDDGLLCSFDDCYLINIEKLDDFLSSLTAEMDAEGTVELAPEKTCDGCLRAEDIRHCSKCPVDTLRATIKAQTVQLDDYVGIYSSNYQSYAECVRTARLIVKAVNRDGFFERLVGSLGKLSHNPESDKAYWCDTCKKWIYEDDVDDHDSCVYCGRHLSNCVEDNEMYDFFATARALLKEIRDAEKGINNES